MVARAFITLGIIILLSSFSSTDTSIISKDVKRVLQLEKPVFKQLKIKDIVGNGLFYEVKSSGSLQISGYSYTGRVFTCNNSHCSKDINESEYFDYLVIFDSNISILNVKVLDYNATHGHAVTSPGWLKQFRGFSGNKKLETGVNIDAISGATISVDALIMDIGRVTRLLVDHGNEKL